ncbi:hypothetical protein [Amycolatopsis sp. PS_44_ISF1]|uniref:hypothetical protein n=1 Tax=Amycolatopsis sp. PS_44_ISF1 TaxID=2974917 RepID=UPI0028DD479C|nr:hypothetical protein [Amycolatopsis sp. PS_44_ISF1]MDT8910754.1 hypothetical protein [Amycolatopsis sp. PS_44_ISF1]
MDLSLTRRGHGASGAPLDKQTIGNALVVHPADGMTEQAQALALGVAADTEHDLVVVDLPVDSPISMWESVAKVLPRRRRGVRLVIGGRSRETTALAGQWLAERINRTVLAPDGSVIPNAGGTLFVHSGRGSGWVKFQPGRTPKWEAKRFPRPSWDSGLTAELTSTSSRGVAEPLPGGLWVRPVGFDQQQREHRVALAHGLPALPDAMTIVLGCPGCPPLTLDDVARLWARLPENVRAGTRFVQYGPMSMPGGTTLGQAIADLLGREIAFYPGLPVLAARALDVRTVLFDGRLGWSTFVREIGYRPRAAQDSPTSPRLLSHRTPITGLDEIAPAVYWYAPDAVIEVVQSGLLVRPPKDGPDTPAVRAITLDHSINNLTFDAPSADAVDRMRLLAEDVLARLDEHTRAMSRVLPAAALLAERSRGQIRTRALGEIEAGGPEFSGSAALGSVSLGSVAADTSAIPAYQPATDLGLDAASEPSFLRSEPTITQRLDPGLRASLAAAGAPITITSARLPMTGIEDEPAGEADPVPAPPVPVSGPTAVPAVGSAAAPTTVSTAASTPGPAPVVGATTAPTGSASAAWTPPRLPPSNFTPPSFTPPDFSTPPAPPSSSAPVFPVTRPAPIPPALPPAGMPMTSAPVAVPPATPPAGMPSTPTPPAEGPSASASVAMPPATPLSGMPMASAPVAVPPATPPAGMPSTPTPPATPPAGLPSVTAVPPAAPSPVAPPVPPAVAPPSLPVADEPEPVAEAATPTSVPPATPATAGTDHPTGTTADPVTSSGEATSTGRPATTHRPAALQPTPGPESTALLPKRGVDKEREWLRKSLGAEYGLMSNSIARILSEHPGFQGALSTSSVEVLTDAVAVQLYLSAKGTAIDAGLRSGVNGPHVPIARCVVAGLARLPSHRGPATFATSLSSAATALYRSQKVLTEWGFLNTLTQPSSTLDGDTDVLVWSITARRTKLLEPADAGVDNRVLFVPGTSFKVLELREPADGARGLVLLRELTSSEVDETGKVASDRISLDELALVSLRRELEVQAEAEGRKPMDKKAAERFNALPGLV